MVHSPGCGMALALDDAGPSIVAGIGFIAGAICGHVAINDMGPLCMAPFFSGGCVGPSMDSALTGAHPFACECVSPLHGPFACECVY